MSEHDLQRTEGWVLNVVDGSNCGGQRSVNENKDEEELPEMFTLISEYSVDKSSGMREVEEDTGGSATKKCVFSLLHPSSDIRATLPTSLTCRQNAYSVLVRLKADSFVSLRGVEVESSQWRNRLYRSHLLFLEEETYCDIRNQKCLPGHISQIS
ncbi:hypothetical protein BLNAU_12097 [Blattamonas nauphoetae]|uniref:Uncharacterized protein n=1 Tax=Blattamonas nauphoetae TaxID=2049346 RepID=A0ABQ9XLK5_9EUKA|nr:hypothetical protein BLNAU_12097 [Blattamonas nauphoetae]